jgi:hypothetical protein
MADLFSHVLVAYVIFTVASWRVDWLTKRWVGIGMIGALLPDLSRIGLFVTDATIESILEVPFGIGAIHTLGGLILFAAIGSLVVADRRRRAFGLLVAGGLSHLLADGLKVWADGAASAWLYPFSWYRHPTPGLYISSDPRVLAVVGSVALAVALVDRRLIVD